MKDEYVKRLDFDSDTFEQMKVDMNFVLQRLLDNMLEKGADEGSMTVKIDVSVVREFIPNYDPKVKGENREISKPTFKHKVTSSVKISDEKSGKYDSEMELVLNDDGIYELRPIANTQQRSIFDDDFNVVESQEEKADGPAIEKSNRPLLPFEGDEPGDEYDDITDELLGKDDYGYDDPEDEGDGDEED